MHTIPGSRHVPDSRRQLPPCTPQQNPNLRYVYHSTFLKQCGPAVCLRPAVPIPAPYRHSARLEPAIPPRRHLRQVPGSSPAGVDRHRGMNASTPRRAVSQSAGTAGPHVATARRALCIGRPRSFESVTCQHLHLAQTLATSSTTTSSRATTSSGLNRCVLLTREWL